MSGDNWTTVGASLHVDQDAELIEWIQHYTRPRHRGVPAQMTRSEMVKRALYEMFEREGYGMLPVEYNPDQVAELLRENRNMLAEVLDRINDLMKRGLVRQVKNDAGDNQLEVDSGFLSAIDQNIAKPGRGRAPRE